MPSAQRTDRPAGRRAARPPRRLPGLSLLGSVLSRVDEAGRGRLPLAGFVVLVAGGAALLLASAAGLESRVGGVPLGGLGAIAVSSAYTWALAARTGGRPVVFGTVALAIGVLALVVDSASLRTGAAVMTAALGASLGVLATVPDARILGALREVVLAFAVAALGAVAAIGFEPVVSLARFEYATLFCSFAIVIVLVYRLGEGFHGLGRRGLVAVLAGALGIAVVLAYGELLRRYGTTGLVESLFDLADASRAHLGAFLRPIQALIGVPALAWGIHRRVRRRDGWWACAFGVTGTAPIAALLVDPRLGLAEIALTEIYSLLVGGLIAAVAIWLDVRMTGSPGSRSARAEPATQVEPPRTCALL